MAEPLLPITSESPAPPGSPDNPCMRELVENNLSLVPYCLNYKKLTLPEGMSFEDAAGYGYIGLIRAAMTFRPGESSFSTYAIIRICGAIQDGIRNFLWFPPKEHKEGRNDIPAQKKPFYHRPTVILTGSGRGLWLKEEAATVYTTTFIDRDEFNDLLEEAMEHLTPKEQQVIRRIYTQDESGHQAAKQLDIPVSTVNRTRNRALKKLRESLENSGFHR